MKKYSKVIIGVVILLAVVVAISAFYPDSGTRKYDSFAQCLTDSGAKMYGAYWCPHCQSQKKMFSLSVDKIVYVECDPRGDNALPQLCEQNKIEEYPTWIFGNGERIAGEVSLKELSFRSNCTLPSD